MPGVWRNGTETDKYFLPRFAESGNRGSSLFLIKDADVVHKDGVADGIICFRHRCAVSSAVTVYLRGNQNKGRTVGGIFVRVPGFMTVYIEGVAIGVPKHTEAMELGSVQFFRLNGTEAPAVLSVAAGMNSIV